MFAGLRLRGQSGVSSSELMLARWGEMLSTAQAVSVHVGNAHDRNCSWSRAVRQAEQAGTSRGAADDASAPELQHVPVPAQPFHTRSFSQSSLVSSHLRRVRRYGCARTAPFLQKNATIHATPNLVCPSAQLSCCTLLSASLAYSFVHLSVCRLSSFKNTFSCLVGQRTSW